MPKNTSDNYLRTLGYVLRRTNYGEADRILNIATPVGRITAIAKSVRKEKSKLAGNIEMFSLIDLSIHKGKGEFGIITGAKMLKFYDEILKDFNSIELASSFLKKINMTIEGSETEEYFNVLDQSLKALNERDNKKLIEAWFLLNIARVTGEEMNLYRDNEGKKLEAGGKYDWDLMTACFTKKESGEFGENEIKVLRLMMTNSFDLIKKVKVNEKIIEKVFGLVDSVYRV